jgi:hypothetical protein
VYSGQIVENGLELVLLHPGANHHQLLHKAQDVGPGQRKKIRNISR